MTLLDKLHSNIQKGDFFAFTEGFDALVGLGISEHDLKFLITEACIYEREEMVLYIFNRGYCREVLFSSGDGLVSFSASKRFYGLLSWLVCNGFDIDKKDDVGYTSLYDAIDRRDFQMALFLLKNGANLDLGGADETSRNLLDRKNLWHFLNEREF